MTELAQCMDNFAVFAYLLGILTGAGLASLIIFWLFGPRDAE